MNIFSEFAYHSQKTGKEPRNVRETIQHHPHRGAAPGVAASGEDSAARSLIRGKARIQKHDIQVRILSLPRCYGGGGRGP